LSSLARAGANPEAVRQSVRNGLASEWTAKTIAESQDPLGRFASGKFASQFSKLGDETQDLLFGAENASRMRNVMDEFRMLGAGQDDVLKMSTSVTDSLTPIQSQIQSLKVAVDAAKSASGDSFSTAIRSGKINNPETLVTSLLNNPGNYSRLRNVVGEEQLARPGGVKDMVSLNLIRNSFNQLDEASIQSGAWGKTLKQNILKQNENGALNEILGADVVSMLSKVADEGVKISDVPHNGHYL
jgi:hypothetical protein